MFVLPKLPYEKDSLEPFISAETLEYHYWKHHQTYVDNLNKLITWTEFENKNLEEIIKSSNTWIFNNASQVWNHTFYWNCLTPNSSKTPNWKIFQLINDNFWSFEAFKEEFSTKAVSNFGSWWTWLVKKENWSLEIINTSNANNPLTTSDTPLLVIDVWEHAYYVDVRNARAKYVENFWNLVNWDFVEENLNK